MTRDKASKAFKKYVCDASNNNDYGYIMWVMVIQILDCDEIDPTR